MKANILLNVVVISQNNGRRHGLVKSLVVVDHVVKYLVINPGGILSKAQFFKPENIVDVNYKRMVIGNEKDIIKVNGKKVKAYLEEAFPLMDYQVVDINGEAFGHVVNATIEDDTFAITEYEISRSFFDDIDHGFAIIPAADLVYKDQVLYYEKEMFDIGFKNQGTGIANKLLGVK
ncbi:hypothetical protein LNN31_14975 [Acetobacterium wieringae]|jgi:uncharacterized protein YrrD|uniref:PRC-barrel domain protein n=1 Tax=Acetobacterium wieringae TaxID=52694 RepID=A0A1F2PI52_9FIRM|nr:MULTISPECIES: hypothetical protein [Acetobacterium]HAZ06149.1 hypothetical protein [Acetobacterium sp.]MEA4806810.1 hypothetical protein [Acetobacterium wieringae]OFV70735.1 hypothetical protein ACWI_17550 [Acetobacterium wieringae]OXS27298.1 MAG: hypothetical protein BI182_01370 [Acetobacterium sp. MES1]URN83643.1 hypothetical protein CHL1_002791 [Acetobacterium wieringae]